MSNSEMDRVKREIGTLGKQGMEIIESMNRQLDKALCKTLPKTQMVHSLELDSNDIFRRSFEAHSTGAYFNNGLHSPVIKDDFMENEFLMDMTQEWLSKPSKLVFPRQTYKPLYQNAFQKIYYESMMMKIMREINSNPMYIARIVMGKLNENSYFVGRANSSVIIDSWPVQSGKAYHLKKNVI